MQSGKIMPVIRQFFGSQVQGKRSLDSHSQNQGKQQGQPEREPTHEEAQKAFQVLLSQEEFKKQGLTAELKKLDGHFAIVITDRAGLALKTIKGTDILRLLGGATLGSEGHVLGRILDRRV